MFVGEEHAGETWTDVLAWKQDEVKIGEEGFGMFSCHPVSMSIYVNKDANHRCEFANSLSINDRWE